MSVPANISSSFQSHLEGLRGIAIILILLFHLGITGDSSPITLPGGYLGVEVFLVLSGYLLALGFLRKSESCAAFCSKKLLRVMFPLCVMLVISLLVCPFCMDYVDICNTAKTAIFSAFALSNFYLAESGAEYFSDDSTWNPILHTWYVAIAIQIYFTFYLGWRLLKDCKKLIKYSTLMFLALASFMYGHCDEERMMLINFLGLPVWLGAPDTMYYSTFARVWEPLAGVSVLFLPNLPKNRFCSLLPCFALVAILFCVLALPSLASLWVVFLTIIIIRYGGEGWAGYVIGSKLLRLIGRISFSVYLVHMPIIVCHKYFTFMPLNKFSVVCLLLSCIIVGWMFWIFVEKRKVSRKGLLGIWMLAVVLALVLHRTVGLKDYWNKESNAFFLPSYSGLKEEQDLNIFKGFDRSKIWHYNGWIIQTGATPPAEKRTCYMHRLGSVDVPPSFVLMGDSHAGHYVTGLDTLCQEHNVSGVSLTTIVIPFWNRLQHETKKDYYVNNAKILAIMEWLKQQPSITHVVLGQTWIRIHELGLDWMGNPVPATPESNLPMLKEFCSRLKAIGKKVVIMGPEPRFEEKNPMRYYRFLLRNEYSFAEKPNPKCICLEERYYSQFGEVISFMKDMEKEGVCSILYPHKYLFTNGIVGMEKNGNLVFRDHHHLSVSGSELLVRAMWPDIANVLQLKNGANVAQSNKDNKITEQ